MLEQMMFGYWCHSSEILMVNLIEKFSLYGKCFEIEPLMAPPRVQ